jgi:hypothetical protein
VAKAQKMEASDTEGCPDHSKLHSRAEAGKSLISVTLSASSRRIMQILAETSGKHFL